METDETFAKIFFRSFGVSRLEESRAEFRAKDFHFVAFCHKNSQLRFCFASACATIFSNPLKAHRLSAFLASPKWQKSTFRACGSFSTHFGGNCCAEFRFEVRGFSCMITATPRLFTQARRRQRLEVSVIIRFMKLVSLIAAVSGVLIVIPSSKRDDPCGYINSRNAPTGYESGRPCRTKCVSSLLECAQAGPLLAQGATIRGSVVDPTGAVIPDALVRIYNHEANSSREFRTDRLGRFTVGDLGPGDYDVKVMHAGFETFSQSNLHLGEGSLADLDISMRPCKISHLGKDVPSFATIQDRAAKSEGEKDLIAQAELLPCNQNGPARPGKRPSCANLESMHYFFDLVHQNQNGRLPEAGEGPVGAKAYYGATVGYDQASQRWTVKLTMEYVLHCGTVCGEGIRHIRYVYFDQQKRVINVEDDPDGVCAWVS